MQRTPTLFFAASRCAHLQASRKLRSPPIVRIANGTFYRQHPASKPVPGHDAPPNPPLFPDLTLTLPSVSTPNQHWAILSPSSSIRTAFLQILRGQYLCFPPTARSFPYLLTPEIQAKDPTLRFSERAIEYVGFDVERKDYGGAYLSARYESRVEETDFTLERYLTGQTNLNPDQSLQRTPDQEATLQVVRDLELEHLLYKPVSTLSNGQSRRARIGKALLMRPEMLCLDAPFIGLDPIVTRHISDVLKKLAEKRNPRVVLSLRPQDTIPEWVSHVVYAGEDGKVDALGTKEEVLRTLKERYEQAERDFKSKSKSKSKLQDEQEPELDPKMVEIREVGRHLSEKGDFQTAATDSNDSPSGLLLRSRDGYPKTDPTGPTPGDPVVEMRGVRIAYGTSSVLGDWTQSVNGTPKQGLWWTIRRGERWGIFGPNGSGKTTLISLVTSDHPQTYSAPVRIFQRSRLPEPGRPGITIFELQSRMGHASPEVHALFPKRLSVRRTLESAWSETPITVPRMDRDAEKRVDAVLRWFEAELNPGLKDGQPSSSNLEWASYYRFGELSFSAQRVVLFLRAIIRNPDIVILDEAFSGMDDLVRDKCLLFLSRGEGMRLHYHESGPHAVESEVARKGEVVVPGLLERQALLCVAHARQEVPGCVREWICLPEKGMGSPRVGRWDGPVELERGRWDEVWDVERR